MKRLNLKDIYPDVYTEDEFIYVSDVIANVFNKSKLDISAQRIKIYRYKAFYSLDCNDGIEDNFLIKSLSLEDELELQENKKQLYIALSKLTEKQRNRIYAYYFLHMSKSDISKSEKVNISTVSKSIKMVYEN